MKDTDLDPKAVVGAAARAAASYEQHAVLAREVESRLLERAAYFEQRPNRVLDLGCGTGRGSHRLAGRYPNARIVALDVAPAMLRRIALAASPADGLLPLCADMHALPLASARFDLVYSNLALPWVRDPEVLMGEVRRVLRPGGLFLFSSLGPDSLKELRAAWAAADDRLHVHPFEDMHNTGDRLVTAGFVNPVMDVDHLCLHYPDTQSLLRELKATGGHNAMRGRQRGLTGKSAWRAMLNAYSRRAEDGRYPASFEIVYGAAFGPAEGQPVRTATGEEARFSVAALREKRKLR